MPLCINLLQPAVAGEETLQRQILALTYVDHLWILAISSTFSRTRHWKAAGEYTLNIAELKILVSTIVYHIQVGKTAGVCEGDGTCVWLLVHEEQI